jgi:UDP-N-acetylglucosamine acyltransferase
LKLGAGNVIHPGAVVGNISQDLKYRGEETEVIIGSNNHIRECATIQQGTAGGGGRTVVGDNCLIMAYAHVAHDCRLGNHVIIVNSVQLAGHVIVHDNARIEGICGIHQYCTIGAYSFVGFLSRVTRDVPPFMIVEGNPARQRAVNVIGLQRAGFGDDEIALIKRAHRVLVGPEGGIVDKIERLRSDEFGGNRHIRHLAEFVAASHAGKNGRAQGR